MNKKQLITSLKYNYKKHLYKEFDIWCSSLLNAGVIFFGITINMISCDNNDNMVCSVVDHETAVAYISNFLTALSNIDFVDCCFGSVEVGSSGIPHIHCVVGFRIPYSFKNYIRQKIEQQLTSIFIYDYKLSYLSKFIDVTRSLRYLSKDFDKKRRLNICFSCSYSYVNNSIQEPFDSIIETSIPYLDNTIVMYFGLRFHGTFCKVGRHSDLIGFPSSLQKDKDADLIYYLVLYMSFRKYLIYKDSLYQKYENSILSYKYLGNREEIKKNFISFMFDLKENFFDFIDPVSLSLKFSLNSDKIIESLTVLNNFSKRCLNLGILEFEDGLYIASTDTFILKSDKIKIDPFIKDSFFVTRYYPYHYSYLSRTRAVPKLWKSKLLTNLTEKDFLLFALIFRNILFTSEDRTKRNILFLTGVSNSGKSRLILDIAKLAAGAENVGTLSPDTKFLFENLIGKKLAIIDEADFNIKILNQLKKFGSGEAIALNSKFKRATYEELTTQILAASNHSKTLEALLKDPAIKNRVWQFIFNEECELTQNEYNGILNEIPKILIFCNKLYFSFLKNKPLKLPFNGGETPFLK
jgi:hypothetical protein